MKEFNIEPLKGYGEIPFGMTLDNAIKVIGRPNFYEELSDMEETQNRSIYFEYDDLKTSIYFEGITKSVAACFETENDAATLFGEKVFQMDQNAIIELMKQHGYVDFEKEDEDEELRISYEELLIDFFFDSDKLSAVSWGVLVDEQGNII